jgi:cell division protein FtsB
MTTLNIDSVNIEQVLGELRKQNAETRKFVEEAGKLSAERNKLEAERYKLDRERQWYPLIVGAAVATAASAFGAAFVKFFF